MGSLLGAWKDGGRVRDLRAGGRVPGQWEGNTDNVPALLTEGEHVINAEAAKKVGHETLQKMNREGLELRHKGHTPRTIRTTGLR